MGINESHEATYYEWSGISPPSREDRIDLLGGRPLPPLFPNQNQEKQIKIQRFTMNLFLPFHFFFDGDYFHLTFFDIA